MAPGGVWQCSLTGGHVQARCDRQEAGISNSFDFQNSAPGKLNVVVYHNDTSKIGGGGGPGNTQRVVKPVDAVINTWLKDWLGAVPTLAVATLAMQRADANSTC